MSQRHAQHMSQCVSAPTSQRKEQHMSHVPVAAHVTAHVTAPELPQHTPTYSWHVNRPQLHPHTCGVSLRLLLWLNIAKSCDKPQIASSFFTGAARQTCMYALHAHALHRACFAFTAPSSYQPFMQHSTAMYLGCQQQLIP